jgi:6-bladed beta-propeller
MHTSNTPAPALALAALLSIAACSDPDRSADRVSVDTVAGIVHVHNASVPLEPTWSLGRRTAIGGGLEADEAYSFGRITGVTVLDGRIYVADAQSRDIRVFDRDGRFVFRFGRAGEGPGEFSEIDALAHAPDGTLLARDPRLYRVTRFDAEGRYLASYRLMRPYPQYGDGSGFHVGRDGWFYDRLSLTLGINSTDSLAVIAYDDTGVVRDTVLVAETSRKYVSVTVDQVPHAGMPVPFAAWSTAAVGPDGRIARSLGATFEFDLLSPAGSVQRTVELDVAPVPVSATERDSLLEAMRHQAVEMTDGKGRMQDFEFPGYKAQLTHLFADADGYWWAGANLSATHTLSPAVFEIFDPAGIRVARLDVPFRIMEIGHAYVAGTATDELGVQTVVVAVLERGGSTKEGS